MKKTAVICCLSILLLTIMPAFTAGAYTPTFAVNASNYILKNTDTGDVLDSKETKQRINPASITMMMTVYVAKQNIKDLNQTVTCKRDLIESFINTELLVAYLKAGEIVTYEDLLYMSFIGSYNDAALILADAVSNGNMKKFIYMMNMAAKDLDMKSTHFSVVNGEYDENTYTTVEDLCKLSEAFFADEYLNELAATDSYAMAATNLTVARTVTTTNLLLSRYSGYYYKYATAGKTGVSDKAGRCLICTASKDGANYLCIVMGCDPNATSDGSIARLEFSDVVSLFKWAFSSFEYKNLISEGEVISSCDVKLSWDVDEFSLVAKNTVAALVPVNADESSLVFETTINFEDYDSGTGEGYFNAPIETGKTYGSATVIYADQIVGEVELVASSDVDRSLTLTVWDFIQNILFNDVVIIVLALLLIGVIICVFVLNKNRRKQRKRRRK